MKNKRGSSTLVAITFLSTISFLLLLYIKKHGSDVRKIKDRAKTYLCFQHYHLSTLDLIKLVNNSNVTIKAAHTVQMLSVTPATAPIRATAKATIKAAELAQVYFLQHYRVSLLEYISHKKYCSTLAIPLLIKAIPYQYSGVGFSRNWDHTTKLKSKKKWKILIKGKYMAIKSSYSIKDQYQKAKMLETKEIKALSYWSQFFGALSYQ